MLGICARRGNCWLRGGGQERHSLCRKIYPKGELLSCVFEKDATKFGRHLLSGQEVKDFRKESSEEDVVFLLVVFFVAEIMATLLTNGIRGDAISDDDWLRGGERAPLQYRLDRPELKKVRIAWMAALTIHYKPEPLAARHIASYGGKVNML